MNSNGYMGVMLSRLFKVSAAYAYETWVQTNFLDEINYNFEKLLTRNAKRMDKVYFLYIFNFN